MKRVIALTAIAVLLAMSGVAAAQPKMLNPLLDVRTVVSGLTTPSSIAFLGPNDFLVLEKNTGQIKRVVGQTVQGTVLDQPVNSAVERGMLGIALHPQFPVNPTVFLYWTESTTGADSDIVSQTPLLGNRVDRFVWDGTRLSFDSNLIRLRALQPSFPFPNRAGTEVEAGNHNGGKIAFGPDGKLYVVLGDNGRRGQMQNLPAGPFGAGLPDDNFGGPQPDNAHLTGVILRLNDDGSTPADNPFFAAGATMAGEAGLNIQKVFAYGIRNGFGLAFDPISGQLWESENGDDSFDEINRIEAGMNGGWIQIMGPVQRLSEFKSIELQLSGSLQQLRWPPTNIADTSDQALSRLFALQGSHFKDPEFSWKFSVSPAAIGFVSSDSNLGPEFAGDLFVGAATPQPAGGYLFQFKLNADRRQIAVSDPRLQDLVADNTAKNDLTESESLLIGQDFGIVTDIKTAPNGNVFVVSLSDGAVYEIVRK